MKGWIFTPAKNFDFPRAQREGRGTVSQRARPAAQAAPGHHATWPLLRGWAREVGRCKEPLQSKLLIEIDVFGSAPGSSRTVHCARRVACGVVPAPVPAPAGLVDVPVTSAMADGEGAAVGIATELEEILLLGGSGDEMPPPSCPKPAFAAIDPPGPAAAGGDGDASPERTPEPAGDNPGDNQGDSARPAALAPAGPGASDDAGAVPRADSGGAGDQASQAPPPAPPATMPGLAPSGGAGGESPPASPPPAAASATPGPEAEPTARRPAPQQTTTALASTSASGSADPPQRAAGNKVAPSVDTDVSGTVQLPENTEEFILPKPARGSMVLIFRGPPCLRLLQLWSMRQPASAVGVLVCGRVGACGRPRVVPPCAGAMLRALYKLHQLARQLSHEPVDDTQT